MRHAIHPWTELLHYMKLLKARKKYFETQVEDIKNIPGSFS
jgi:hypothetical protein